MSPQQHDPRQSFWIGEKKYRTNKSVWLKDTEVQFGSEPRWVFEVVVWSLEEALTQGLIKEAETTELDQMELRHRREKAALLDKLKQEGKT